MSERLATAVLLTPVSPAQAVSGLERVQSMLSERFGYRESSDEVMRQLFAEADRSWTSGKITQTAFDAHDPLPEASMMHTAGDMLVDRARHQLELLVYPIVVNPPAIGVKARLSSSVYEAVFDFRPVFEDGFDLEAKHRVVGICLTVAKAFEASGFVFKLEDGRLEVPELDALTRRFLSPDAAALEREPYPLLGILDSIVSREQAKRMWGGEAILSSTAGYTILDNLRPLAAAIDDESDES